MDATGKRLLDLMFRPGESVCVSHNKYGFHSVPLEEVQDGPVILVPRPESAAKRNKTVEEATEVVDSSGLLLCALNPIKGFRVDANCTSYRNFLVEMDTGDLAAQKHYVDTMGMPYSACVFSGGKSLHFLISLDQDVENEEAYRRLSRWTLSIMTMADQKTLNPSRSIRIPGAMRDGKQQKLLVFNGPVKGKAFADWLAGYPGAQPEVRADRVVSDNPDFNRVGLWARTALIEGIDRSKGRNQQWFGIACEFAIAGYPEDEIIAHLGGYFKEEYDFKEREWLVTVRSGVKSVQQGKIGK